MMYTALAAAGWQIAPFQEPPVSNSTANNQQLREAAFRVLFQWQVRAHAGQSFSGWPSG